MDMVSVYISRSYLSLLDSSRSISIVAEELVVVGGRISQSLSRLAILVIMYFQRWKFDDPTSLTSLGMVLSFGMVREGGENDSRLGAKRIYTL